jgi:hypothetical protein
MLSLLGRGILVADHPLGTYGNRSTRRGLARQFPSEEASEPPGQGEG